MSRISKWKTEKTKVKVVFRLQFHSTHIPQSGWDKLFVSFIPTESGKATAKTNKANVRNGTCKWADPIYETTRLLYDSKSKLYDEKLYRIVVAMGTSRASILGEATVNLADYVDALKPSDIALPLQGCNFGTILHVTVQLLTSKTGFREFEQQRELRERGLQSGIDNSVHVATGKISHSEEFSASGQTDKVTARIKSKTNLSELSSLDEEVSGEYEDPATGYDISSNTSGSLCAEKHESSCAHAFDSLKSPMSGDQQCDDNKLAMAHEENDRLRGGLELVESSLFDLKLEVNSLQGIADELAVDVQKLSQQLLFETNSSEELVKEVDFMKSECLKLKDEIIELKSLKLNNQTAVIESNEDHVNYLDGNVRLQFLRWFGVVEDKIRELLKKTYIVANDADSKFIYSELEELLNLLLVIKNENGKAETPDVDGIQELRPVEDEKIGHDNVLGLDLCQPQSILPHFSINPPASEEVYTVDARDAMKGQIFDLVSELDESKIEKEGLIRKMNEMECYYETLTQELEENQKSMLLEVQSLKKEHSTCIYELSASRAEIESLHHEMNKETLRFVNERQNLEALNNELERRATTSEASLRRARLNYSIAVDKLQKDLELLSSQVMSVFETNENHIKQALPLQLHMQGEPSSMVSEKDIDYVHLSHYKHENMESKKRSVGGDMLLEDMKRSFCLQQELYQKVEEELIHLYSESFNLDIYSKVLEESLREADDDIGIKNKEMDELIKELGLSTASQDQLMARFQRSKDEIHSLSSCNSELMMQNQLLEDKIMSISQENHLLLQKLEELESSVINLRSFEKKYDACLAEKTELSLSLKHESLENEELRNEVSALKEKLEILEAESSALAGVKADLEESTNFVRNKFVNMLESHNKQSSLLLGSHSFIAENQDIKDVVLLEEIQDKASARISQLMNENKQLESERVNADLSLTAAKSEITMMKQKFKSDMHDMATKLDFSAALADKLQVELDFMAKQFHSTSEFEERYAEMTKTLMDDFALLEDHIREITSKTGHLAEDTIGLDALTEEFDRTNSTVTKLMHDNQELAMFLQDKTQESNNLSSAISFMRDSVRNLQDDLHKEIAKNDEAEGKDRDLTREILVMKQKFKSNLRDMVANVDESNALMDKFQVGMESLASKLHSAFEVKERYVDQNEVLFADLTIFVNQIQELTCENGQLPQELSALNALKEEFRRNQLTIAELMHEKQELAMRLQDKTRESINLVSEVSCLKENIRSLHDESATYRVEAEGKLGDLTSLLKKDLDIMHDFEQQKAELLHVRDLVSAHEHEKSRLTLLLGQQEVYEEKLKKNNRYLAFAESDLREMHDYLIAMDVKYIYIANQYECTILALEQQLMSTERSLRELQKMYYDTETNLNHLHASEARWIEEKANMSMSLQNVRSELKAAEAQNELLSSEASELERLKSMRIEDEEEICYLNVSKEELEILVIVLKWKLAQVSADLMLLARGREELTIIRSQYNELSHKLSQQVLKTEEFKNLSTHLKELKDKAEAECLKNRENREADVSTAVNQDSLRIAFLKEQYETKVQDLTQMLSISKKHGEEMLMKFQDAIDELENRKKSEAVNMKKIEELSHRLAALEVELVSAVTEKREKSNAYDRTKAELECALLSVECCREEKEKLEASLLEFESEKSQTAEELALLKEKLESLNSLTEFEKEKINCITDFECEFDDSAGNSIPSPSQQIEIRGINKERQISSIRDEDLFEGNGYNLDAEEEHIRAQRLRSSLEHLHEELEKMKNENSYHEDHDVDPNFQVSQTELIKLQNTNEELRSMYPLFDDISSNGNALERVLALEIELAEALKVKNKPNVQFQSSFLKQHSGDEAIFKSFRDINELIREMLDLKGRHASVEAELRDMHERYSQLSLHFAEVEGERQKLKMTLKNVRGSQKITALNQSSSTNIEHSPS